MQPLQTQTNSEIFLNTPLLFCVYGPFGNVNNLKFSLETCRRGAYFIHIKGNIVIHEDKAPEASEIRSEPSHSLIENITGATRKMDPSGNALTARAEMQFRI